MTPEIEMTAIYKISATQFENIFFCIQYNDPINIKSQSF